jgi:tetratricopeptide (TPR) repeat protein
MIVFLTEQQRYAEALALFATLSSRSCDPRLIITKAFCLFQEHHYTQVLELLISIERQGWATTDCFLLKAKTLYQLSEFETAKKAFETAEAYRPAIQTRRWLRRCAAKIDPLRRLIRFEAAAPPEAQLAGGFAPAADLWDIPGEAGFDAATDGTIELAMAISGWSEIEMAAVNKDRE